MKEPTGEMVQLSGDLESMLRQFDRRGYLYQVCVYEIAPEQQIEWLVDDYFGNAFAQAWWLERRKTWEHERLVEAMDGAVANVDDNKQ